MILPGQSLTAEPKNAPYENPPEMVDPEEAILWHLERLTDNDRMDAVLDSLELGMDVVTMTEGILRGAVLDGRHSIDVSLIIAPVIHELINSTAEQSGIDYEEGLPDETKGRAEIKYQINSRKARKALQEAKESQDEPEVIEEEIEEPMKPQSKGLMARRPKEGAQ